MSDPARTMEIECDCAMVASLIEGKCERLKWFLAHSSGLRRRRFIEDLTADIERLAGQLDDLEHDIVHAETSVDSEIPF